jgi:hypothetical protein
MRVLQIPKTARSWDTRLGEPVKIAIGQFLQVASNTSRPRNLISVVGAAAKCRTALEGSMKERSQLPRHTTNGAGDVGIRNSRRGRSAIVATAAVLSLAMLQLGREPLALAHPMGHEAQAVIDRLLAPPTITAEPGFSATLLVPPGELYDPLFMVPRGDTVWMNDDGREIGAHGSRILEFTLKGKISVLIDADKLLPTTGIDVAPADFGSYGGQIFTLAQPAVQMPGALANHVIQRIDPKTRTVTTYCTLPPFGKVGNGIAGFGVAARFGPAGSPYKGAFYAIAALNDVIYAILPDGTCKEFADFSKFGSPAGLTFTNDNSAMLVTVSPGEVTSGAAEGTGLILRVAPDGRIDPTPVVTGLTRPFGLDVAPAGFGKFKDEIFVTDAGDIQIPVPATQALKHDGKIYRATPGGKLQVVATGLVNPAGARFIGNHLWITDINGDFIAGKRELPDGLLVQIDAK